MCKLMSWMYCVVSSVCFGTNTSFWLIAFLLMFVDCVIMYIYNVSLDLL